MALSEQNCVWKFGEVVSCFTCLLLKLQLWSVDFVLNDTVVIRRNVSGDLKGDIRILMTPHRSEVWGLLISPNTGNLPLMV